MYIDLYGEKYCWYETGIMCALLSRRVGEFPKRMIVCRGNKNGIDFHLIWTEDRNNCPLNSTKHFEFYAAINSMSGGVKIWYSVCQPSNGGAPYSRIVDSARFNHCLGSDATHTLGAFFAMKGSK